MYRDDEENRNIPSESLSFMTLVFVASFAIADLYFHMRTRTIKCDKLRVIATFVIRSTAFIARKLSKGQIFACSRKCIFMC